MKRTRLSLRFVALAGIAVGSASAQLTGSVQPDGELAYPVSAARSIVFHPAQTSRGHLLAVTLPSGETLRRGFGAGELPAFFLGKGHGDGLYKWELKASQAASPEAFVRAEDSDLQVPATPTLPTVSGAFRVSGGVVLDVHEPEVLGDHNESAILRGHSHGGGARLDSSATITHADDVSIQGSLCAGFDCSSTESFGFDTIRLKENNLRVKFEDTSNTSSFPTRDWEILINDTTNGGTEHFSVRDVTAGVTPFRIEGLAPTNSLVVESDGDIGIGTSSPATDLHIVSGDTPAMRLHQDGSVVPATQVWDIAANETYFFLRDITNGSRLPLRIQSGAPTDSFFVESDGDVGIGKSGPEAKLDVRGNIGVGGPSTTQPEPGQVHHNEDIDTALKFDLNDIQLAAGGVTTFHGTPSTVELGQPNKKIDTAVHWNSPAPALFVDGSSGFVGIGTSQPFAPLHMETTGKNANFELERVGGARGFFSASSSFLTIGTRTNHIVQINANNSWRMKIRGNNKIDFRNGAFLSAAGTFNDASSRSLKENIRGLELSDALEALGGLEPVRFFYKADTEDEQVGFIAEDVPALVADSERRGLSAMQIAAVLTKVVQDQQERIASLEERLAALEAR